MRTKRWTILPAAPDAFLSAVPEHPLLAQVLYNRGLTTPAAAQRFLATQDVTVDNPYRLRDMTPAVQRILHAIQRGETICVYGDFDVDGVSATALLVSALQVAGARVGPYIPNRVDEGYGLNLDAIGRIAQTAQVLVTVDCGIRSVAEVAYARQVGLDVIVTDHHTVGRELPPALAVINPRRPDCPAHTPELAGVGVAYRLAQAVLRAAAQSGVSRLTPDQVATVEETLLDLVALGTVADVMPLLGENRSLVQRGLTQINWAVRPGLAALMEKAGLKKGGVDATAIAFRLAPRLNAAGRLASGELAYQLLRATDTEKAVRVAEQLEELNTRRRTLMEAAHRVAEEQLAAPVADGAAIYIVGSRTFEHGIVGLVAGKIAERYYRPAVVMHEDADEARGSARSIPEFDISRALDEVSDLLVRHGGHQLAAGFTVKTARLPDLRAALEAIARRDLAAVDDLRPQLRIDAPVQLDDVTWGLHQHFTRLEPTGHANPSPVLMAANCRVRGLRTVGGGNHLRLVLDSHSGGAAYDAIAFQQGAWLSELGEGSRIDVAFQVEVNDWQQNKQLQLNVQDLRPAA
jgi:single-stranded-DNA-specific exonuclease